MISVDGGENFASWVSIMGCARFILHDLNFFDCLIGYDHLDFKLLDINLPDVDVGYQKCSKIAVGLQTCGHSDPIPVTFRVPDT